MQTGNNTSMFPSAGSSKKRNIAAPFQPNQTQRRQSGNGKNLSLPDIGPGNYYIDFRNHTFQPLTPLQQLRYEHYVGPTNESNWVLPGILLVGAYPASQDDIETFELITSILKLGVRKFVCLQQEYRPGVPEHMWREGLALRPYFEDVQHIVANKNLIPALKDFKIVDYEHLSFEHCPIIDCGITDDSKVLELARKLAYEISTGEVIYLHCWGGHGRTGTIVSIMLHIMYGLNPYEAMERCQVVHDLRRCRVEVGSPQTQTQRDQVIRVVNSLMRNYRESPQAPRVTSPSMLTRVMSPATSTLKKLFGRASPSTSAQNSAANLLANTAATGGVAAMTIEVAAEDHHIPSKEEEIQPATPTLSSKKSIHNNMSNVSNENNDSSTKKNLSQKSLTFTLPSNKEEESAANIAAKNTPNTTSTNTSEGNLGLELTHASSATTILSPTTPAKSQTPSVTPLATPAPRRSFLRQSTEKLQSFLSNPSSPEPHQMSEIDESALQQQQVDMAPLVKHLHLSNTNLHEPVAAEQQEDSFPTAEIVLTKEVLNLQTGGSFTVQKSRQSSGSDAFLSPMRDEAMNMSLDKDGSLGIKLVASADSYDDQQIPILMATEHVDTVENTSQPPSFRASTAGSAIIGPLDGTADSDGARLTRAASTTSVGPGQFSRQASINKKDLPPDTLTMSRLGSINGFMEPINATSIAPSIGPGQFSRQSSFKRSETNASSRRGSTGGGDFPALGRFSRQSSMKGRDFSVNESGSQAIAEVQLAGSAENAGALPSNSASRRGSFTGIDNGVRSTVASARQAVTAETSAPVTVATAANLVAAAAAAASAVAASVSNISSPANNSNNNNTTTTLTGNASSGNLVSPTGPVTAGTAAVEEKKRPVPPLLARSPGSGRNFGGVAQSSGRKIDTVAASPSSPTDTSNNVTPER